MPTAKDYVYVEILAETQKAVAGLANLAAGFGKAWISWTAAKKVFTEVVGMAEDTASFRQVADAFAQLAADAGLYSQEIVAALKKASKGTLSELDTIGAAARASTFQIPMESLPKLMEISRATARSMGIDVTAAFNDIVLGIARAQPRILDNLGLLVKVGEQTQKFADAAGKTQEELTALERQQAILNGTLEAGELVIQRMGVAMSQLSDKEKLQQFAAAWKDFRIELGRNFSTTLANAASMIGSVLATMTQAQAETRVMRDLVEGSGAGWINYTTNLYDAEQALKIVRERLDEAKETLATVDKYTDPLGQQDQLVRELTAAYTRLIVIVAQLRDRDKGLLQLEEDREGLRYLEELEKTLGYIAQKESRLHDLYDEDVEKGKAVKATIEEMIEAGLGKNAMLDQIIKKYGFLLTALLKVDKASKDLLATDKKSLDLWAIYASALADRIEADLQGQLDAYEALIDYENRMGAARAEGMNEWTKSYEEWVEEYKKVKKALDELDASARRLGEEALQIMTEGFGTMVAAMLLAAGGAENAAEMFFNAWRAAISGVLRMLAQEWAVKGAALLLNPLTAAEGAGLLAKAVLAYAAAALIDSMAMAEGGVVTGPTHALIGEKGPEAVIPLDRYPGGFGLTQNFYVRGSMITEAQLMRRAIAAARMAGRGY